MEAISHQGLSRQSLYRYLYFLQSERRVYHLGFNAYASDTIKHIKDIIEAAVSFEFLSKVNVWDAKAAWDLWNDISDLYEQIPVEILMDEFEMWFKEHLKVYIASNYELRFEPYPITHALIELVKAVSLHLVSIPVVHEKGFKMVIDFSPQTFLPEYRIPSPP